MYLPLSIFKSLPFIELLWTRNVKSHFIKLWLPAASPISLESEFARAGNLSVLFHWGFFRDENHCSCIIGVWEIFLSEINHYSLVLLFSPLALSLFFFFFFPWDRNSVNSIQSSWLWPCLPSSCSPFYPSLSSWGNITNIISYAKSLVFPPLTQRPDVNEEKCVSQWPLLSRKAGRHGIAVQGLWIPTPRRGLWGCAILGFHRFPGGSGRKATCASEGRGLGSTSKLQVWYKDQDVCPGRVHAAIWPSVGFIWDPSLLFQGFQLIFWDPLASLLSHLLSLSTNLPAPCSLTSLWNTMLKIIKQTLESCESLGS